MAPNGKTIGKNNSILVVTLLLLLVGSSAAEKLSMWGQLKEGITQSLFPRVEVTLYNESDEDVLYMCSFGRPKHKSLRVLEAGKQFSWNFTQFAFPLHWCYLYVNDVRQGFFWAYGVRSRCLKCFWKVGQFPYLYRSDRNRWERQQLFPPPNIRFAGQP